MRQSTSEKRRYPRLDTSNDKSWKIRVFGMKGRPIEGKILNLSLGGVAFLSHWRDAAKTVKRFTTKVEISLPGGKTVNANSSFVRILPSCYDDECLCVLTLNEMSKNHSSKLQNFLG